MRIAIPYHPLMHEYFDSITERIRARGHEVAAYENDDAFLADRDGLRQTDIILTIGSTPCGEELIKDAPRLRAIMSAVTGMEGIDVAAATAGGVIAANQQTDVNCIGMAEGTVLLMLATLYDLNETQRVLRENLPRPPVPSAMLARGRTIGYIGFGAIAREMALLLSSWGLKQQFFATSRAGRNHPNYISETTLEELLQTSDIVVVLCSLNDTTRKLLDARRLGLMKPDAILINTARGAICDEDALYHALKEEKILRAGLDTFVKEPLPEESPLRTLPNAILTPHMVGHTLEGYNSIKEASFKSIMNVVAGKPPLYVKNPEILEEWTRRWA